jgi:squalene-hopene/tetraprenyl-beta-curcumene cyclase
MKAKVGMVLLAMGLVLGLAAGPGVAAETVKTPAGSQANLSLLTQTKYSLSIAYEYLLKTQRPDGSWEGHPAITALAVYSFLLAPQYNPGEQVPLAIDRGLKYIVSNVKPDGGIYDKELPNYVTAICLLALSESNRPAYKDIIKNAKQFLIQFQDDEDEGYDPGHLYYGGIGYGGDSRPDLSNTQFALEGLKAAEDYEHRYARILPSTMKQVEKEETELGLHWKKALIFLARCQNVKSINAMAYATDDGGFIYEPGTYNPQRSHSYGTMTYAGLKSLLYARVDKNDIRVKRAYDWIRLHYTLDENPGFSNASIYNYYYTFAKSLDALGESVITDSKGQKHNWREDYLKKLVSVQKAEGYWENTDGQYRENIKALATAYATVGMKFALHGLLAD